MALQLHRLFPCGNSSTSSHLPVMLQCRTLQNYPATCLQLFPTRNGSKYNKCALLEFRKSGGTCCMMKGRLRNHRFRAERDSFLPSSFGDCRHSCAVTFQTQLRASFSFPIKYCNSCTYSRLQSNLSFKFSSQECGGRRFLSTGKASVNLSDGKTGINNIPRMLTEHFQKQAKSFVVRSIGSSRQIAVSSQQSKKSASDAITSVPKDLHLSKSDVGKKDAKLELSLSASAKSTSNSKTTRIQGTKKQIGKKKEKALSGATVSPGDAEANGSKQASHMENLHLSKLKDGEKDIKLELSVSTSPKSSETSKKSRSQGIKKQLPNKKGKSLLGSTVSVGEAKVKVKGSKQASNVKKAIGTKNAGQSSQTSEVLATGETPLSTIDDSPLVHEQSKKTVGKPTKTSKSQKKATVHIKSDKASSKLKSSPVVVEVTKMARKKELRSLYPPTGKSVVVVESLTKAKVIQGYLGNMFEVLPSYGHMRDLAGKSGSVCPDDDFSMVWEVPSSALTHLKSIKVALHGVENLILASDPDREGEAIAWHIYEMLQQQDALHDDINVSRVVFHEITESSIKSALQTPRDIDANLVHAYLARRALDYLIGFSISPLLWRKLPACQSAGRVQSAALAIICDRELKIDEFKPQEYWSIEVEFNKREPGSSTKNSSFPAHLTHLDLKKLEQHSIGSCEEANAIEQKMMSSSFEVLSAKTSKTRRNPPTPYITSTLQQDAANKLNFSASYTMKLAQKLYEGVKLANDEATGLITYMRTDGLHISDVAAKDIHSLVIERYGGAFASESIRKYFKKVKNAQEAHEAIRPTSIRRLPSMLTGVLDEDSLKLYSLIWSRTMACQMVPTVINQIQIDIGGAGSILGLRSTCSKVEFFGFQAVYKDTEAAAIGYNEKEEDAREEGFEVLQKLKTGDSLNLGEVEPKQHFTQPPSRYSEGSLVKKLEELGIGRPSTYASTIKVLQDRKYVTVKSRTLHPEFRGRMASAFLSQHFSELTDYSFTADMETELDNISAGMTQWKGLLKDYWTRFKESCDRAGNVDVRQVEKMLEKTFGDFLFTSLPNKSRTCPSCSTGTLIFKVSRFGAGYFIGCDQHPNCKYIAKTIYGGDEKDVPQTTQFMSEPKLLGLHPTSNEKILLKSGPFGFYIQLGEDKKGSNKKKDKKGHSPKRVSVSQIKDVDAITFDQALDLLQYPLLLGNHPDDGLPVYLNMATYGFSIRHRRTAAPVQNVLDPKEVTLEEAIKLLLTKEAKQSGRFKTKPKKKEPLGDI